MSTYRPQQPFKGMTLAQMKKKWQSMTPKERSMNVQTFRDAAKKAPAASKPKPAPAKSQSTPKKPQSTPKKPQSTPKKPSKGGGTTGRTRPSNPPSPTVVRSGSRTGASVDPRERSLRRNRQQTRSRSTTAGRRNIRQQVEAQSGSAKRDQRTTEARRRRAREAGLKKNRRELLAKKYNKD